jgi:methionyl-tRNA synthetase
MKTRYITTPLYYVNAAPHIGHAYTTLAADILTRYKRGRGEPVQLLTGTDEHGSKIEEAADAAGLKPLEYADKIVAEFKTLWTHLNIEYDDFIRTTEKRHTSRVQAVFAHLQSTGDIYKGVYKGYYCVACETYWTETEAPENEDGKRYCQNQGCGKELALTEEESFFFKLSKYGPLLLKHYQNNPGFLQPSHRAKEIVNFVKEGLHDLAVSRTKVAWGVGVLSDPEHVVYVWFDALLNYLTATGYVPPGMSEDDEPQRYAELWPADVHFVGKEIYRFHTVTWPAMLLALGVPLPASVFAHGWWTVEGQKMSKSKNNFVDPRELTKDYGVDAFRYFLFREMPFGNDGNFSKDTFRQRYNSELANDFGNLVSRTTNMVDKYLAGELPENPTNACVKVTEEILNKSGAYDNAMKTMALQEALDIAWSGIRRLNEYINETQPWKMAKADPESVAPILFDLVTSLRLIGSWLSPFMPQTASRLAAMLGLDKFPNAVTLQDLLNAPRGAKIEKSPALFPRMED